MVLGPSLNMENREEPLFSDQLADFVENEYNRRRAERKPFELQWRLNIEFVDGNQYLDIDPVTQTIQEIPKMYWYQEREVFNQIATIVETRISRLSRQRPMMKVRPASNDESDLSASKVSSALLNATWHDQDMDILYSDFLAWLEITGTVFLKTIWNVNRGRTIIKQAVPKAPEEVQNIQRQEQQQDVTQMKHLSEMESEALSETSNPNTMNNDPFMSNQDVMELKEGDVETVVVPPYQIFPETSYLNGLSDMRSIIHAKVYHIKDIEEMFGVQVEPEESQVMQLEEMKSGLGGIGYSVGGWRGGYKQLKDHAVVKEYYERPSKKYPNGRFIVVAGKKTLHAGPLPFAIGKDEQVDFPFVQLKSITKPGSFWGKSIVERCIPVQRRYNALRNRKAEYLNLVTIGQWYEPIGSIDEDTELNNSPGARIRYRPGVGTPEPVQFPNLPGSFENEIETLLNEFTAISGISELSRYSEAPSGVKSGVALSIANEQDDTRLAMTTTRIASGIIQLGKHWLRLFKQFVNEPRAVRIVGSNRELDVMYWTASQLNSDDVIVENTSALSETPAQRRQMVFDLINTGIFMRPETNPFTDEGKQKILELLEYGHWENNHDDERNLQISRARRENASMMNIDQVAVQDFDNHELHIKEHNKFRMQPEYEKLLASEIGPYVDIIMREHLAQHYQALAEQQMLALQSQMMMQQQSQGQQEQQEEGG